MGAIPNRPRREPYFLSSHMLYLTSQSIKLRDFLCFEVLIINKDHCKRNGANWLSGWRDMHIIVPFPLESTLSRPIVGCDDSCDLVSWFFSWGCFALSRAISWRSQFIEDSIFWFWYCGIHLAQKLHNAQPDGWVNFPALGRRGAAAD